ncbi:hypothetical protein AVEN_93983-1 [Araneus ventricosus]|uniref:Uncharacterized protein n=1 Tax=Araneus ventricosus TaxID=182803 RepID=A0A4Y2CMQ9_ARAVE|nr:hypothetical protein AVEN_93983-1 [Araneus ventricosus]
MEEEQCLKLGIHKKSSPFHLAQREGFFLSPIQVDRLGRSFKEVLDFVLRTLVSEGSKSETASKTLSSTPTLSSHTRKIYRRTEESKFTFYGLPFHIPFGFQIRLNSSSAIYLRQFSSGFHIDERFCLPVFQPLWSGVEQR